MAPCCRNISVNANPIPEAAPVTMTTLSGTEKYIPMLLFILDENTIKMK
jgi:hypothetical protein